MKLKNKAVLTLLISSITIGLSTPLVAQDTSPARMGPSTTLTFADKTSQLSTASKLALDLLIKDARSKGKVNEYQVAVWSDNPAPRESEQLSKADRVLAQKRAKSVNAYLKGHSSAGRTTYNMAERANWLARLFDTPDAELKAEMGIGGDRVMSRDEFQIFKTNGAASKAVILAIMKH
jgi:hypothetical protein